MLLHGARGLVACMTRSNMSLDQSTQLLLPRLLCSVLIRWLARIAERCPTHSQCNCKFFTSSTVKSDILFDQKIQLPFGCFFFFHTWKLSGGIRVVYVETYSSSSYLYLSFKCDERLLSLSFCRSQFLGVARLHGS